MLPEIVAALLAAASHDTHARAALRGYATSARACGEPALAGRILDRLNGLPKVPR